MNRQLDHVALLTIYQITIGTAPQMAGSGAAPADLFASPAIDQFVVLRARVERRRVAKNRRRA